MEGHSCWLEIVKALDTDCVLKFGRRLENINACAPIIHFSNIKNGRIVGARADIPGDTFQLLICGHIVYKIPKDTIVN